MTCERDPDRGAVSLSVVLLAPMLVVLMFAGFQAAMWNHAKAEARVIAREAAVLVARDHLPDATAAESATASLTNDGLLAEPRVEISHSAETVIVTVSGRAPGILRGTSTVVSVRVALPAEGWVAL